MKRFRKVAVLVMIFILSTTLAVFADNSSAEITLTPAPTSAKVGESITIDLSAKCATGIEGIDSTLTWDSTKLELTNQDALASKGYISMSGTDESTGEFKLSVLYGGSGKTPTESSFATLNFKILEAAKANEKLSVTLSGIEVGDSEDNWITVGDKTVQLTVLEDTPPAGDENVPSEDESTPPSEDDNVPSEDENTPPAEDDNAPSEDESTPPAEDEKEPSEDENTPPAEDENEPAEDENEPSEDESTPPAEDTKDPSQEEDTTIADKPINNAGLANYAMILAVAIILTVALYLKCKKYKDVK